jgi:periplasmic divalent cation tolerance protein
MPATDFVVVLTTAGSEEQGEQIARELVARRLAACVNVVPGVCSVYRWKGEITRDEERLLLVKTTAGLFPAVREAIRELHTYELPEVLALPVADGDPAYLRWLEEGVEGGPIP